MSGNNTLNPASNNEPSTSENMNQGRNIDDESQKQQAIGTQIGENPTDEIQRHEDTQENKHNIGNRKNRTQYGGVLNTSTVKYGGEIELIQGKVPQRILEGERKNLQTTEPDHVWLPPRRRMKWWMWIYDKEKKSVLRRTGKSWCKICTFYALFYAGLALLWMFSWSFFLMTLTPGVPSRLAGDSPLSPTPGMTAFPRELFYKRGPNPEIVLSLSKLIEANQWTPGPPCGETFGYDTESPCFFLKLNRLYGWKPSGDIKVKCQPRGEGDSGGLGSFVLTPESFPAKSFPFLNQEGYKSPLVAVSVSIVKPDVQLSLECFGIGEDFKEIDTFQNAGGTRVEIFLSRHEKLPSPTDAMDA